MLKSSRGTAVSSARTISYEVLEMIAGGAYASDSLAERLVGVDSRDAGLASHIVFGVLRYQSQLDYLIRYYSGREVEALDQPLQIALRCAIFQLRYLDRIPPHAAVHETVELLKRHKRAAAGLANAVLRKVNREDVAWPDVATALSCPSWLMSRWSEQFGEEQSRGIAAAALAEPVPYIRVAPGSPVSPGMELEETSVPGCYRLTGRALPGTRFQDIGSQAIVPLLDLRAGQSYLDLCAAPGNKTAQALETKLSLAIACDVSERRLREMAAHCPRVVLDAGQPLPFAKQFDRIFVDAPCSNTGTLARNPEIKWRVQSGDFIRFRDKQFQIVSQALTQLARGGKLLYATCSLEPEENETVVRAVLADHPGLRCTRELRRLPGRDEGDGFYAAVLELVP